MASFEHTGEAHDQDELYKVRHQSRTCHGSGGARNASGIYVRFWPAD